MSRNARKVIFDEERRTVIDAELRNPSNATWWFAQRTALRCGNVTGVTFLVSSVSAKRLELLHELVPKAAVIAALLDVNNLPGDTELKDIEAAARMRHVVGRLHSRHIERHCLDALVCHRSS